MGQSLARSVEHYNRFVGTLESRVLVTARRLHELGIAQEPAAGLDPLESGPRALSAPELLDNLGELGRESRDEVHLAPERGLMVHQRQPRPRRSAHKPRNPAPNDTNVARYGISGS